METSHIQKRVYYHDTDCGGVVYYANYLKYLEEGRTEHFQSRGIDFRMLAEQGLHFVVAKVEIEYKKSGRYLDILTITTGIERARSSVVRFRQTVSVGDTLIAEARVVIMCVGDDHRPQPLPHSLVALIRE